MLNRLLILLIGIAFVGSVYGQATTTENDSLLYGKWRSIKDTRGQQYADIMEEFKSNGDWLIYQNEKLIESKKWITEKVKVGKSKFLIKAPGSSTGVPVLKVTKSKLVLLYCECDILNNFIKKNSYRITYERVK
jgi:hypothetical protein